MDWSTGVLYEWDSQTKLGKIRVTHICVMDEGFKRKHGVSIGTTLSAAAKDFHGVVPALESVVSFKIWYKSCPEEEFFPAIEIVLPT